MGTEQVEQLVWVRIGPYTFIRMTKARARALGLKVVDKPANKMSVPREDKRSGRSRRAG